MRVKYSEDEFDMRIIKHDKDMRQIDKDMKEMTEEIERLKGKIASKREIQANIEKKIFKDIREQEFRCQRAFDEMAKVQRELAYFKKNSGIFPAEIIKTGQKPKARAQSQADYLDVQDINKNKSVGLK